MTQAPAGVAVPLSACVLQHQVRFWFVLCSEMSVQLHQLTFAVEIISLSFQTSQIVLLIPGLYFQFFYLCLVVRSQPLTQRPAHAFETCAAVPCVYTSENHVGVQGALPDSSDQLSLI